MHIGGTDRLICSETYVMTIRAVAGQVVSMLLYRIVGTSCGEITSKTHVKLYVLLFSLKAALL